jgi:hypothetical protein
MEAAQLIAQGNVIGWCQGKMEFGPRALGNRSILADPRPKENKDRINSMVKKREGYRPFAPSVIEERVRDYFELPDCELNLDFMVFNLNVKKHVQEILGATTHVNGTSRVQTVNKYQNPKYWQLIKHFEELTGVGVLLNTSFNNMAEPIVATVHDAITCFLTTGLDYLIIEDYLISKVSNIKENFQKFTVSLVPSAILKCEKNTYSQPQYQIYFHHRQQSPKSISEDVYNYLLQLGNQRHFSFNFSDAFINEIFNLWSERYLSFHPIKTHTRLYYSADIAIESDNLTVTN